MKLNYQLDDQLQVTNFQLLCHFDSPYFPSFFFSFFFASSQVTYGNDDDQLGCSRFTKQVATLSHSSSSLLAERITGLISQQLASSRCCRIVLLLKAVRWQQSSYLLVGSPTKPCLPRLYQFRKEGARRLLCRRRLSAKRKKRKSSECPEFQECPLSKEEQKMKIQRSLPFHTVETLATVSPSPSFFYFLSFLCSSSRGLALSAG